MSKKPIAFVVVLSVVLALTCFLASVIAHTFSEDGTRRESHGITNCGTIPPELQALQPVAVLAVGSPIFGAIFGVLRLFRTNSSRSRLLSLSLRGARPPFCVSEGKERC